MGSVGPLVGSLSWVAVSECKVLYSVSKGFLAGSLVEISLRIFRIEQVVCSEMLFLI